MLLYVLDSSMVTCEGKKSTVSCAHKPGTSLHITHANYGRTALDVCLHPILSTANSNCRESNSLTVVRQLCEHRVSCMITASNSVFGDPCGGIYKYLEVGFECVAAGWYVKNVTKFRLVLVLVIVLFL